MKVNYGQELNSIADRYYNNNDVTRKAFVYLAEFERLFGPVRNSELHILELGVSSGASLLMWRDYFPNAIIVGLDIEDKPIGIPEDEPRIRFIKGSQDDPLALEKAAQASGDQFDLIIDDASHVGYLTKRAFCYLFPRWLKPGGVYFIEDFGTGYFPMYPYGCGYVEPSLTDNGRNKMIFKSNQFGMVGFLKQLVDHMMKGLVTKSTSPLNIARITFIINCAIIKKSEEKTIGIIDSANHKSSKIPYLLNRLRYLKKLYFNKIYWLRRR